MTGSDQTPFLRPQRWRRETWRWPLITPPTVEPTEPPTFPRPGDEKNPGPARQKPSS